MVSKTKLTRNDDRELWEMLDYESPALYEYFKYFLSLGATGKVYQVTERFDELKLENTYNLSNDYHWIERRKAYQVHLNKIAQAEIEKTVKEMARRQASNAMLNENLLMLPVKALLKKVQRDGSDAFDNMSVKELMKLSLESARLHPSTVVSERLARGLATEISKGEINHSGEVATRVIKPMIPTIFDDVKEEDE